MVLKATAKFSMETFILFGVSQTRDIFPWKLVEKTYYKTDTLYITMHTYNIFTGKSFLKSHCFEECQNCTIYNHHRAEKIVDVKPHPTEFGHHPIEQYSGVSQKLNFLFETGAIILNIDII